MTPDGTAAPRVQAPALATRNRALLWDGVRMVHGVMRLGAFKLWGEEYDSHVPLLGSRVYTRRDDGSGEEEPVTPTPAQPPANGSATPTHGSGNRPA